MSSGAGVCLTTGTTTTSSILVTVAVGQTTSVGFSDTYTTANGAILTCWNPATGAVYANSPTPLSATNTILACYVILIF